MKKLNHILAFVLLIVVALSFSSYTNSDIKPAMPPGIYLFSYTSTLGLIGKATPRNWEQPRAFTVPNGVRFQIVNDSLIYKHDCDKDGKIKNTTTARRTASNILKMFKPVPKNYLDYELVGVYSFDHLPKDMWVVYYYSKKRKSLLCVSHTFELNRIDDVMIFMEQPEHPFTDYKNFFKVLEGKDASYYYPVMKERVTVDLKKQ